MLSYRKVSQKHKNNVVESIVSANNLIFCLVLDIRRAMFMNMKLYMGTGGQGEEINLVGRIGMGWASGWRGEARICSTCSASLGSEFVAFAPFEL